MFNKSNDKYRQKRIKVEYFEKKMRKSEHLGVQNFE